ncbi:Smr/MutS family protein [Chitinilyticum aquatile]|uniref:Smr/MutS family protein n=1 Tax=Chitinilyticum aquatile TaxID=362520 RepID=UPI0003FE67C5|nr:Smr/MutS family protein [Chitinilyticum aquatile]
MAKPSKTSPFTDALKPLARAMRSHQRETLEARLVAYRELPPPPKSDRELFLEAMQGVLPHKNDYFEHPAKYPSPHPVQRWRDEARVMRDAMTDFWPWDELETGEELLYLRPGVRPDSLKKLRRGEWVVQGELDLHGLTSEYARPVVGEFLHRCRVENRRCVRIVHGKGLGSKNKEPVLKLKLKNWLAQRDEVLAFCQARPFDGGSGAVLVLLKGNHER